MGASSAFCTGITPIPDTRYKSRKRRATHYPSPCIVPLHLQAVKYTCKINLRLLILEIDTSAAPLFNKVGLLLLVANEKYPSVLPVAS
jgi:hypothetical protein